MTSPQDPHARVFSHINGSTADLLDRLAVAEICKGWPIYRDASEWQNFRSLFAPKATVWTTWSGPCDIDAFIDVSKQGKKQGVFIQHRECGTLVEMGPARESATTATETEGEDDGNTNADGTTSCIRRAVGKMKATITQRFVNPDDGIEFDVDCDCRFIFFCEKVISEAAADTATPSPVAAASTVSTAAPPPLPVESLPMAATPHWRTVYVKLIYEKDKIVPADGHLAPKLTADERQYMRDSLPDGYRYLGVMQRRLGYVIDEKLPTPRNAGWERMYSAMEAWLAGRKVMLG